MPHKELEGATASEKLLVFGWPVGRTKDVAKKDQQTF